MFLNKKVGCDRKSSYAIIAMKSGKEEAFMRKKISLALATISALCFCSCDGGLKDEPMGSNATYDVLGTGEMPIGMWITPPDKWRNDEAFANIAACGINLVNGFANNENTDEEVSFVLDACQKYGLKYLYASTEIGEKIEECKNSEDTARKTELIQETLAQIDKFASHPAYAGQLFKDEPSLSYFDALADFMEAYRAKYTGKLPYVNMFPNFALAATGCSRYEDYVDKWIDRANPVMYSYDDYPLLDYDPAKSGYETEMAGYYHNLDLLRVKTLEQGIPFWSFIATLSITRSTTSNEPDGRAPSREDVRWTVFSNLAFGVKGIQYFTYYTSSNQERHGNAMVDRSGNFTETYYNVKEVNTEFKNYDEILLNADAVGVMFKDERRGGFDIYSTPLTNFGGIREVQGNKYLIGCFSDKDTGKKSVLITPTTPRDDIELSLKMHKSVKEVTVYIGGEKQIVKVNNQTLNLKIRHGDAVFMQL